MRRRNLADSEIDQLQKVRRENKRLKEQISQLRKQISRIDVDRFQNLKDLLDAQDRKEQQEAALEKNKALSEQWKCWHCESGILRLVVLERRDGVFYNRVCDNCKHRTKLQKYHDKVKGPR